MKIKLVQYLFLVIISLIICLTSITVKGELILQSQDQINESPEEIREGWEEIVGFDIWKPYFIFKTILEGIQDHLSINLWSFKGRFEVLNNYSEFFYIFKKKF